MKAQNLKQLREQIKDRLDREQAAHILTGLGYAVGRDWKFALREEERTPSASIRQDGFIKDFGSDWSGDIVALLHEVKGMPMKDSVLFVCQQLGISTDEAYEHRPLPVTRKPQQFTELTDERHQQITADAERFSLSRSQTFADAVL